VTSIDRTRAPNSGAASDGRGGPRNGVRAANDEIESASVRRQSGSAKRLPAWHGDDMAWHPSSSGLGR
jgi:hypothetical protein